MALAVDPDGSANGSDLFKNSKVSSFKNIPGRRQFDVSNATLRHNDRISVFDDAIQYDLRFRGCVGGIVTVDE